MCRRFNMWIYKCHVTSLKWPYPITTRRNRYLLKFIDHFSKYVQFFPNSRRSGKKTCALVYATQIIARQGSGFYAHGSVHHNSYYIKVQLDANYAV